MILRTVGIVILVVGLMMTRPGMELQIQILMSLGLSAAEFVGWIIAGAGFVITLVGFIARSGKSAAPPQQYSMPQAQRYPPPQNYGSPQQHAAGRWCPNCGRVEAAGKNFCTGCGSRLA